MTMMVSLSLQPQLASAWKLHLDEPLVVRFTFNSTCYLNSPGQSSLYLASPGQSSVYLVSPGQSSVNPGQSSVHLVSPG